MAAERLAVFRADASTTLGSGHVMRCLTLAGDLTIAGWRCAFACNAEAEAVVPGLGRAGYPTLLGEDLQLRERWPDGADLLVVDHYGLDAVWEGACRPWARRILVIDDLADRPHDCDVLVDQTIGRTAEAYAPLVPKDCRLLLGPDYALLRPQFAAARAAALARRDGRLERVVVGFGSADPDDMTSRALEAIAASGLQVSVEVVLSRSAPHVDRVRRVAGGLSPPALVHVDVEDMAALFSRADLAIGAGGTTSWERCALGLPSLVVVVADNQRLIAEALDTAGAAVDLGWHEAVDRERLVSVLTGLDSGGRERMAHTAAAITDGMGAPRLVEALS